jgi:hypothetical protein
MPNPRKPCPCQKCNGALVSVRTARRHASLHASPLTPDPTVSFTAWSERNNFNMQLHSHDPPGNDDTDSNAGIHTHSNSPDGYVSKGHRGIVTVRLSYHCSFKLPFTNIIWNQSDPHPYPEPDQPLDDPNDMMDIDQEQYQTPGLNQDSDPDQWEGLGGIDDPDSENLDNFNSACSDDDEQREMAQAAELRAYAETLRLFDQPERPSTSGTNEEEGDLPAATSRIETIKITQAFIKEIHAATLDNGNLDDDILDRLRNPQEGPTEISDPDIRLSLDLFLACTNASEETYKSCRDAILHRYPASNVLSYYSVKKLVAESSGVVAVYDDMCINSCHAFTGPFSHLESCSLCGEARYDAARSMSTGKKIPRQQFSTILLGPQLQALRRSYSGASNMRYLDRKIKEVTEMLDNLQTDNGMDMVYDDVLSGSEAQDLAERLNITGHDTVVSSSLDGAQLYQNKKSDTWISIWILHNLSPKQRYQKRHVLPGTIIPGPNKPKITDSYLFRGIHHLSALQRENNGAGLRMWDALEDAVIQSRIIFSLATADALGMTELDGRVGHHGAHGCRLGCPMKGRHKPHTGHYFAVHLKPNNYTVRDCNHPDIDIRNLSTLSSVQYQHNLSKVVSSIDQNDYERNRKETGISKPSILSGLVDDLMFPLPHCFALDLMHLLFINLGELLIPLWRGTLKCDSTDDLSSWDWATLTGDIWQTHGQLVAGATPFFPSSFHRPPRNPAEKISSGYKATEYYLYLFGLGPGFFRSVIPPKYWKNFCKLVRGVRILTQRHITGIQLREAHSSLVQFVEEFENLYYQRHVGRLHFCRPCVHTLLHTCDEVIRVGPGAYSTQFTMERTIGNLGQEIRQPSNPFANLARRALLRSQVNALKNIYPELNPMAIPQPPDSEHGLGKDYTLLGPKEGKATTIAATAGDILLARIHTSKIRRWGRLRLPNGQIARSLWCEIKGARSKTRVTRNVKVRPIIETITVPWLK